MTERTRLQRSRPRATPGIVHLGPGAFFKAFVAVYTDDLLRASGGDWGIVAVSLKSDHAAQDLRPQDCAYTAVALEPDGGRTRVIEAVSDVLVAPQQPEAVLRAMSDPRTRILSLTVTEKGYGHIPTTGALDIERADVAADLRTPGAPLTAPGMIVAALARRREAGLAPFTVLSCDNLPDNGATARRVVLDFAALCDVELAAWIADTVTFPSTMVDRITPATTPDDIAQLEAAEGYYDPACVMHEPFRQWVIEDRFCNGRPNWAEAGAQFVTSVEAHEKMKLRCLNGTHSALAYLGYLSGCKTVLETVNDDVFAAFCKGLWADEILPTVPPPEGENLQAYTDALLARYRNPAIRHLTWQIAMDGSQKLPQRLLGTISDRLRDGHMPQGLCLAVAGWMRYVSGTDEQGQPIDVRDPLAERLKAAYRAGQTPAARVAEFMALQEVFPKNLSQNQAFTSQLSAALEAIEEQGARASVAAYLRHAPR